MIMCSQCKKRPAVVFLTSTKGNERKNENLCLVCAKERNIPQVTEYMKKLGITDDELEQMSNQMMDMMDILDGDSFEMGGSNIMPPNFILTEKQRMNRKKLILKAKIKKADFLASAQRISRNPKKNLNSLTITAPIFHRKLRKENSMTLSAEIRKLQELFRFLQEEQKITPAL